MKFFLSSVTGLFLIFSTTLVSANPYLYTFSGTVDYIEIDGAYYSDIDFDNDYTTEQDTIHVGETLEYVFLVDFDLAGFCEGPLATSYSDTCTGAEILDSEMANYFFTTLHSATKLAPATEEDTTFNYGLSLLNTGWLVADSAVFIVSPYNRPVESWVAKTDSSPGTIVIGTDAWAGINGTSPYGRINSTLELISIEPYIEGNKKAKRNKKCMKTIGKGKRKRAHKWKKVCK